MHDRYVQLFERLTSAEALALWSRLLSLGLLEDPPPGASTSGVLSNSPEGKEILAPGLGAVLGAACRGLMHSQVVVSIADRPEGHWCRILDKILEKPVYVAARGETGIPDLLATSQMIHRRGEPLGIGQMPSYVYNRSPVPKRRDDRVIVHVQLPNPKTPGSASHARYSLYRQGMTVTDFLRAGGWTGDVAHDAKAGYIQVDLPPREE